MDDASTMPSSVTSKMTVGMEVTSWTVGIYVDSIRLPSELLWRVQDSLRDILRFRIANGLWRLLKDIQLFCRWDIWRQFEIVLVREVQRKIMEVLLIFARSSPSLRLKRVSIPSKF
jgi:hypothetical protein